MSTRSKRPYGQLDPGGRRTSGAGNRLLAQCSYAVNVLLVLYFFHLSNQRVNQASQDVMDQPAMEILHSAMDELANSTAVLEHTISTLSGVSVDAGKTAAAQATLPVTRAVPAATHEAADGSEKVWLFLGIPTVPRRNDVDYLTTTLNTLNDQLPVDSADPFSNKVRAVVMNNKPGHHLVYDKVKAQFEADGSRGHIQFVDNPGTIPDPAPHLPDPDDLNNPTNRPGHEVRKQTCDLITLMEMGAATSQYYMFMEDDFRVCNHFVRASHYIIDKANREHPNWLAIRVSYGMNGIIMRSADLNLLSKYLRDGTARLPPDLLWQEWVSSGRTTAHKEIYGRPLLVYKQNLLDHIGTVSSFAIRPNRPKWPGCYESMASVWSLSRVEQYDRTCARVSDLSPCGNRQTGGPEWLANQVNFQP